MNGEDRRRKIIEHLKASGEPLSGSQLAKLLDVSRQVIVQDMALLRATNHGIIATSTGYVLQAGGKHQRVIHVAHHDDSILDELYAIVDLGGRVLDVRVEHKVYGSISAELSIKSRKDARKLMDDIASGKSSPLKNLTHDDHYHLIEADSEEDLDAIISELKSKGYLMD
ncbi:transcription repressor NadR [Youngiibacter fragilis]|uniref:DeoR family transcriptional regulator n=1 Tax=Youngiibacter fragilis 232.1 TaxID=994573 RepID=V7I7M3_9CLOT|nr:transcription repressor NadR [Youngiibacter fragilis]ETA81234.1 DeoR family transcriptional regulator [Youngiibacter fragilis 232.1]